MDSLERLQGLHADLVAFSETRLANIDRLWQELEESIQEFRRLLDKPTPTTAEREAYNAGKITIDQQEYGVSDDFKHISRAIAAALDLEELEGGKLWIRVQAASPPDEEPTIADVVSVFHNRRDLLLQTLRLALQESLNDDLDPPTRSNFQELVAQVLDVRNGPPSNGSIFASRCLAAMEVMENWQSKIGEQLQSRTILGEARGAESYATLEFQRESLFKQHEAMGCILASLFQGNYTISEDLRKLSIVLRRMTRLDFYLIHYLPAFAAGFRQYGSPEGTTSQDDSKSLNRHFGVSNQDGINPAIRPFKAVLELWWTVEYGAWFRDITDPSPESDACVNAAKQAIQDSALEFLISTCASMSSNAIPQPARQELVLLILGDGNILALDSEQTSDYFTLVLMEHFENLIEAWITNMPDSIRKLKSEEDEHRLLQITAMHEGLGPNIGPHPHGQLHLECLLVLISFAFEHRPSAADQWWEDLDSNLYGFLQWASKRQTVPRVSAFCEMLISISNGQECATAAHKFLLDESIASSTFRGRRIPSMNYAQMFAELELYANKVHERPVSTQVTNVRSVPVTTMNELESPLMLSCYLRLLAHICRQTALARQHILGQSTLDLPRTLLKLSSGPVPTYLRASVFNTIEALLTDKDHQIACDMWKTIDEWASNSHDGSNQQITPVSQTSQPTMSALQNTLTSISVSFDQYDAFVVLLRNLCSTSLVMQGVGQLLPFPIDLGSSYRNPGIGPYIDFLCGQIYSKRLRDLGDDPQGILSSFHCLDVIGTCLEGFNENYVAMMERSKAGSDATSTSNEIMYAERHPFSRLMRWLLGTDMSKMLMKTMHVSVDLVQSSPFDSPRILNLQRCIDVINIIIDLQPTYFDIIRPLTRENLKKDAFVSANITPVEEIIAGNSNIVLDLCHYASTDHLQLALRSLVLLQKLSKSAKLNNHFLPPKSQNDRSRRVIDMLGPNSSMELGSVAQVMSSKMQIDVRELEGGFESPGYSIKDGVLSFFNSCLSTQPDLPTTAHLLLGFDHIADSLTISKSIETGSSVFNAIVDLTKSYPDGEDGSMVSWLIHLKSAAGLVLQHLWSAEVSTELALGQLRRLRFLPSQFISQSTISTGVLWDGLPLQHPNFWYSTAAEGLAEFLNLRAAFYGYVAAEVRAASHENLSTVLKQALSTFFGQSTDIDGSTVRHATIFDYFDFSNLDLAARFDMPVLEYFSDLDTEVFRNEATNETPSLYDIGVLIERLQAQQTQIFGSQSQMPGSKAVDVDGLNLEADSIVAVLEASNRWTLAQKAHSTALRKYVDMIIAVVEYCPVEGTQKAQFILQMMQLLLPKLDALILAESANTFELARAADALLFALETTSAETSRTSQNITEKLFQFFRTSIEGITLSSSDSALRQVLYSICAQYLQRITKTSGNESEVAKKARGFSMDCIRAAGVRLISILSDDAEDGADICRLNAFNLLALMTALFRIEKSAFMIDAFVKANVLEILIEPLKHVAIDFQDAESGHIPHLLSIFQARTLLLLQISRTREGASAIIDAGFVPALRASELFQTDPDLGISLALEKSLNQALSASGTGLTVSHNALATARQNYYVLISSMLRVLLSTATSRGVQNEQARFLVSNFLVDYRSNMLGIFKKYAGVSGQVTDEKTRDLLSDCVKSYTGLATLCGFVELEVSNGHGNNTADGSGHYGFDTNAQGMNGNGMGQAAYGNGRGFS